MWSYGGYAIRGLSHASILLRSEVCLPLEPTLGEDLSKLAT